MTSETFHACLKSIAIMSNSIGYVLADLAIMKFKFMKAPTVVAMSVKIPGFSAIRHPCIRHWHSASTP